MTLNNAESYMTFDGLNDKRMAQDQAKEDELNEKMRSDWRFSMLKKKSGKKENKVTINCLAFA